MKVKILHKTPKGYIIGRGKKDIRINSVVIFKDKKIGKVVDIFGPVAMPYIKILPFDDFITLPEVAYIKNHKSKYKNKKKKK